MHYHQKEVDAQDKVYVDIMQTDDLFKNYLLLYISYPFHVFMPGMPGPNGVTEKAMPLRTYPPQQLPTVADTDTLPITYYLIHCKYINLST